MRKTLCIALIFSSFICAYASAEESSAAVASGNFKLDADKASEFQAKQAIKDDAAAKTDEAVKEMPKPQIVTEKTATGRIEKLLNEQGLVVAEKTIEGDKIIKKVLNYYYPEGQLMRRITASENNDGFYAEEYYTNGKISAQSMFLNEQSKIGTEKKYDINGILRQEIPWVLPRTEKNKPQAEQQTVRKGIIKTYYPAGQIAAVFPIGEDGDTIFYDYRGFAMKTIKNSNILNFSKELTDADCQGASIQLSLDDLVELYEDEGDISYNKCGLPYRENFVYEVVKKHGARETKVSYDETGMIRRITTYNYGLKDGIEKKYDAAGNLTASINYKKGLKEGEAVGYFPTKEVAFRKTYAKGKVVDKLTCYFPTGEVAAEISYNKDGLKDGKAIINSPVKREIEFYEGERLKTSTESENRQQVSALKDLAKVEPQCLNFNKFLMSLRQRIDEDEANISDRFRIKIPSECSNVDTYKNENNKLICYDLIGMQRVVLPIIYNRGDFVVGNVYGDDKVLQYEIPYVDKKRQGWAKEYNKDGAVISEIYFDDNKISESARSYYPNGQVNEIMSISENGNNKVLAQYSEKGALLFSITYKDDQKTNVYINDAQNRRDVAVSYYKGYMDKIRISDISNPYNFKDYNLALEEYTEYNNNELVKGGKLCPQEQAVSSTETTSATANEVPAILSEKTEAEPSAPIAEKATEQALPVVLPEDRMPEPPVMTAEEAPIIEENNIANTISQDSVQQEVQTLLDNAVIPSEEDKKQAELAKRNIGPVAKPAKDELTDAVQKEKVDTDVKYAASSDESQTEKFYYPNGNLRKTIKTKGTRTEEIKEYSKNGLLLTDTIYDKDQIRIEKYFGSGTVRRKTEKNYDDNAVNAFVKRQDFYDNGKSRYEIERQPQTMLFSEKVYDTDGHLKSETVQTGAFAFKTKVYNKDEKIIRETNELGSNVFVKEYDAMQNLKNTSINGEQIVTSAAANEESLLAEKAQVYGYNGKLLSIIKKEADKIKVAEYDTDGQLKSEILLYNNGEISVKGYNSERMLTRFAYLAQDGKLHIEKPDAKVISGYRESHWIDYNNPRWIENQDRYSVKSIARLYLDTIADICVELDMTIPDVISKLYQRYN